VKGEEGGGEERGEHDEEVRGCGGRVGQGCGGEVENGGSGELLAKGGGATNTSGQTAALAEPAVPATRTDSKVKSMIPRLSGVNVVLVDDDRDVLEAMETAMKAEGAVTRAVMDGNEAVRVCQEEPPDLVILDMMLPKRSGFLVLEKIKGYEDAPAVIMLTANEGRRHQAYAESLGVDAYMLKPAPLERLLAKSVELLEVRKSLKAAGKPGPRSGEGKK